MAIANLRIHFQRLKAALHMAGKIARMVAYIAWQNHQKPFGFLPAPYCQLARKCIFKIIHYVLALFSFAYKAFIINPCCAI